jgi:hypothetical protein
MCARPNLTAGHLQLYADDVDDPPFQFPDVHQYFHRLRFFMRPPRLHVPATVHRL